MEEGKILYPHNLHFSTEIFGLIPHGGVLQTPTVNLAD